MRHDALTCDFVCEDGFQDLALLFLFFDSHGELASFFQGKFFFYFGVAQGPTTCRVTLRLLGGAGRAPSPTLAPTARRSRNNFWLACNFSQTANYTHAHTPKHRNLVLQHGENEANRPESQEERKLWRIETESVTRRFTDPGGYFSANITAGGSACRRTESAEPTSARYLEALSSRTARAESSWRNQRRVGRSRLRARSIPGRHCYRS